VGQEGEVAEEAHSLILEGLAAAAGEAVGEEVTP